MWKVVVVTRNQSRFQQEMEERQQEKELRTGAQPKSLLSEEDDDQCYGRPRR